MLQSKKDFPKLQKRFDRDAIVFDKIYSHENTRFTQWFNQRFRKPIYERFNITSIKLADLQGKSVIDVGCGTGSYLPMLVSQGAKSVLGMDFSENMLTIAQKLIEKNQIEEICTLKHANFMEYNFHSSFDFAIAMGIFDYLSDPLSFLLKLKTITSSKILISFPGHSLIRKPLRQLRYALSARGKVYFYSEEDIRDLCRKAMIEEYDLIPMQTGSGFILVANT